MTQNEPGLREQIAIAVRRGLYRSGRRIAPDVDDVPLGEEHWYAADNVLMALGEPNPELSYRDMIAELETQLARKLST